MPKMLHFAWFGAPGAHYWDLPSAATYDWRQGRLYMDIARICESAFLDMVLFADIPAIPTAYGGNNDHYVRHGFEAHLDPAPILAMMGGVTRHLGLGATLSTSLYPPFLLARMVGTLDHLTAGRTAWNVVTSSNAAAAQNYGQDDLPEHDERYNIADEYLELVRRLWDSWAADAVLQDTQRRIFADPAKVKPVHFAGKYFKSRGPLTVPALPQRHPIIVMAGTSRRGQQFAVTNADMVIAHKNSLEDMRSYSTALRRQLAEAGRDPASCKIFFSIKPVMGDTPDMAQEKWACNYEDAQPEAGLSYLSAMMGLDLSPFDLDKPLPPDLPVQGMIGKLLQYTEAKKDMTLREVAKHEAMHETFPIVGTPEQVADIIEHAAQEGGADGFHFRVKVGDIGYLKEVTTKLMPILRRRGLARSGYAGPRLRDNLFAF
ncbi:MAG TPA: NtaA/DmoA family FMN-dependent monooxygenase [Rhodopila sp.]|uniref:NtaA/DmoA family FMN-dependent monooxygenase n=1 Tax=Rhodopila sp. TaxID=2480087 RepID=UPI002CCBBC20|nr:NtaA/DmoA family FMN-dependent monooxygenase [Rhodopila sp.]HVY16590.1 NtaA/DmoA family FMN-dependent monooxygenase [Rhodopila sp.]